MSKGGIFGGANLAQVLFRSPVSSISALAIIALGGTAPSNAADVTSGSTVTVTDQSQLGLTTDTTIVHDGGTLAIDGTLGGGITIEQAGYVIGGLGVGSGGALRNISGNNTILGPISLSGDTHINSVADVLTIGGDIALGSGQLSKDGAGTLTLTGGNSYTDGIVVSDGELQLANGGKIAATNDTTIANAAGVQATVTGMGSFWTTRQEPRLRQYRLRLCPRRGSGPADRTRPQLVDHPAGATVLFGG